MYLKASYTVEGAAVIGTCMVITGMCILLGFEIYSEVLNYVETINIKDMDPVETFRNLHFGKDFLESVTNR